MNGAPASAPSLPEKSSGERDERQERHAGEERRRRQPHTAKQYNDATRKFVESGKVDKAARDAEQAIEGEEADELKRAEEEGRSHAAPHEQEREI